MKGNYEIDVDFIDDELLIIEREFATGKVLNVFKPKYVYPLGHSDISESKNASWNIRLQFEDTVNRKIGVPITIYSKVYLYALVQGGWLPIKFFPGNDFIIDKNLLSYVSAESGTYPSEFLESLYLNDFRIRSRFILDPLFCAMEGRISSPPTGREIKKEYKNSSRKLKIKYPNAGIRKWEDNFYKIDETLSNIFNKAEIFISESLKLTKKLPPKGDISSIKQLREKIDNLAERLSIRKDSFMYYSVLTTVYPNRSFSSPVHKIFDKKDSSYYNGISDLKAIMYLMYRIAEANKIGRGNNVAFVTADKSLAQFWSGLKATDLRLDNNGNIEFTSDDLASLINLPG